MQEARAWTSEGVPSDGGEASDLEEILVIRRLEGAASALALGVGARSAALVVNIPAHILEVDCRLGAVVLVLDRVAAGASVVSYHLQSQTEQASAKGALALFSF